MATTFHTDSGIKYSISDSDEIHRGGEGRIMALKDPNFVAKLYHPHISPLSDAQFSFLTKLDKSLFVVPVHLLRNTKNATAGFIMEYIPNDYFPLSSFFSKNFCAKNGISEKVKKQIIERLINSINYAHSQNIIIGDLNQYNILVNKVGQVKMIDTDSYQTSAHKHTGILLDDIRDYLHGGIVSTESDYFALSVMVFYALTHVHPFKGIHPSYKKISDRMIHHLPVFAQGEGIKVPKVYRPPGDKKIMSQFEELYLKGNRFLMSLSGVSKVLGKLTPVKVTTINEKDLSVTPILPDTAGSDTYFNSFLGYVETEDNFFVYDAKNTGYLSLKYTIPKQKYENILLGNNNVIARKGQNIYHYKSDADVVLIKNFTIEAGSFTHNFDGIVLVFNQNLMFKLYIDEIIGSSVKNTRNEVFGQSFSHHTGLLQNISGQKRTFYNSGKDLASVKIGFPAKEIRSQGQVSCIQYIEDNKIVTQYVFFDGLKAMVSQNATELLTDFAYMPTGNSGFIFEPADDAIKVLRTQDFQTVSLLECPQVSSLSKLQYSGAGIVALENERVYLLNRK